MHYTKKTKKNVLCYYDNARSADNRCLQQNTYGMH